MAWTVLTRESIDLDSFQVLPFGRFSQAEPFLRAFLASDQPKSDLLTLDQSAVGALRRACAKVAGIVNEKEPRKVAGKVQHTKSGKVQNYRPPINSDQVNQACEVLGIRLEKVAEIAGDRLFVQVTKV